MLWLDERTLLVGRGYRTNEAGIAALRDALPDVDVIAFDLPHYHGRGEVMHLLSLISPLADDLAVVYLPLLPVRLVELLEDAGCRARRGPRRGVRVDGVQRSRARASRAPRRWTGTRRRAGGSRRRASR